MNDFNCESDEVQSLAGLLLESELSKNWHLVSNEVVWSEPWFLTVSSAIAKLAMHQEPIDCLSVGLAISETTNRIDESAARILFLVECYIDRLTAEAALNRLLKNQRKSQ